MKISNRAKSALATAGYSVVENSPITQLIAFAAQNSGLEFGNYFTPGDRRPGAWREGRRAYSQEARSITADWQRVKAALMQCAIDEVGPDDVVAAAPGAFSGRLEWKPKQHTPASAKANGGEGEWYYCTGQYFPTEYRKAAATVLEQAARAKRQARPPAIGLPTSIEDLKRLNRTNGGCWFEPGSMRFFGTRIESGVIAQRYFITSEQPPHGGRTYTVRAFDEKGNVDTVGEFSKCGTYKAAMEVLREHITQQTEKAA